MIDPYTDSMLDEALSQTFPASDPFFLISKTQTSEVNTMYSTKNDLPKKTREAVIDLLQSRLADAIDLSTQTK